MENPRRGTRDSREVLQGGPAALGPQARLRRAFPQGCLMLHAVWVLRFCSTPSDTAVPGSSYVCTLRVQDNF